MLCNAACVCLFVLWVPLLGPHHKVASRCADIVIKSVTARVSSPYSPLICQPRSTGRLLKYMQRRWIRPFTDAVSQFLPLSHTHTHSLSFSSTPPWSSPVCHFRRWSKTNYVDWGVKSFTIMTRKRCSVSYEDEWQNQTTPGAKLKARWKRKVCSLIYSSLFLSIPLSRLGYESWMMLPRAALQIMLAHLKRADLCSLSGLTIFFLVPPTPG